jgi:hypothetical protein
MIQLTASYPTAEDYCDTSEGLEETKSNISPWMPNGKEFTFSTYRWPELGAPRLYDSAKDIVIPISGQNYRLNIEIDVENEDWGDVPESAVVTLEATDAPETAYDPYDAVENQKKHRESLVREIAELEAENKEDGDGFWAGCIQRNNRTIADIDNGELVFSHGRYVQVFGQPSFIQNPIFPSHEGRSAYHLTTIETGWGDSGNVNIMVALDAEGVPVRAWFEASCC